MSSDFSLPPIARRLVTPNPTTPIWVHPCRWAVHQPATEQEPREGGPGQAEAEVNSEPDIRDEDLLTT